MMMPMNRKRDLTLSCVDKGFSYLGGALYDHLMPASATRERRRHGRGDHGAVSLARGTRAGLGTPRGLRAACDRQQPRRLLLLHSLLLLRCRHDLLSHRRRGWARHRRVGMLLLKQWEDDADTGRQRVLWADVGRGGRVHGRESAVALVAVGAARDRLGVEVGHQVALALEKRV